MTFPDAWARTMTLDFDLLPPGRKERAEMVHWKIKKLLPGKVDELEVAFAEIPKTGGGARLLVSAAPGKRCARSQARSRRRACASEGSSPRHWPSSTASIAGSARPPAATTSFCIAAAEPRLS